MSDRQGVVTRGAPVLGAVRQSGRVAHAVQRPGPSLPFVPRLRLAGERYTVQCSAVQYSTVLCSAVQYSTVQCSAVQCSTVQFFSTVQLEISWIHILFKLL